MHISEFNRGYYQALNGILLAQKNNDDRYAFLSNLNLNNKKELHNQRREFLKQSQFPLHADYDKGFFAAWTDYITILTKIELPITPSPNASQVKKQEIAEMKIEKEIETKKEAIAQKRETVEEKSEKGEKIEPRQSTLFEFSN
jgi:bifunctional ADP-heptose synthase (sugar kinase/adenylyltransferase)